MSVFVHVTLKLSYSECDGGEMKIETDVSSGWLLMVTLDGGKGTVKRQVELE